MKIAVFHNYMDNIGGAEIVALTLAKEFGGDIFTTNIDKEKIEKMGFKTNNVFSIGKIPLNAPFRQEFAYWKFRKLDLKNKYDFYIIAGDWAMSAALHNRPHIWYVHSPTREIWDLREYTKNNIIKRRALGNLNKYVFDIWVSLRRTINRKDIKKVEKIICNSKNVQSRVKKYLNRESEIIYPPVETSKYNYKKPRDYWLSVNRLINHKRVEIQLRAFNMLPEEKLIIIGSYEKNTSHFEKYVDYCKKIKPENVEIRSWVEDEELIGLYAKCRGLITTSFKEDFGMTPVEAMASGKPVIAPNEGGYKETVINGKTGILINEINENNLAESIKRLGEEINKNPIKFKRACQRQAEKFDTKIFIKKIMRAMKEGL